MQIQRYSIIDELNPEDAIRYRKFNRYEVINFVENLIEEEERMNIGSNGTFKDASDENLATWLNHYNYRLVKID